MASQVATVAVQYQNVEGYHVFTSNDVYGLYVASKDGKKAFESLAPAIKLLVNRNERLDCFVEHTCSYKDFLDSQRVQDMALKDRDGKPLVLADTKFVLRMAA